MTRLIETRLRQLEARFGHLPCDKPGHDDLFVFVALCGEPDSEAETQAKIKSIRECERCKDKLVVVIMHLGNASQPAPELGAVAGE